MVTLSRQAEQNVDDLIRHYEALNRLEASRNLLLAIETAKARIAGRPGAGLPAPRPYPELKYLRLSWIFEKRYWISYAPKNPPVIAGIFFETADIPNRV